MFIYLFSTSSPIQLFSHSSNGIGQIADCLFQIIFYFARGKKKRFCPLSLDVLFELYTDTKFILFRVEEKNTERKGQLNHKDLFTDSERIICKRFPFHCLLRKHPFEGIRSLNSSWVTSSESRTLVNLIWCGASLVAKGFLHVSFLIYLIGE